MLKRILCICVLWALIASVVAPAFAVSGNVDECLETRLVNDTWLEESDVDSSTLEALSATVNIRNIRSGEYVYSYLLIIASVTGTFSKVYYRIDSGTRYAMSRVGTTSRFRGVWNTGASTAGSHTLKVEAVSSTGLVVGSSSVSVVVAKAFLYELYYEIDYMSGHYPPSSVLNYMRDYWKGHAIKVSFWIDDVVTDPTPGDGKITNSDFWKIEKNYNNVWKYDDRSFGGVSKKFTLREKWMLYGTWAPSSTTAGYTWVIRSGSDVLAGNYIFIADSMIDKWEAANTVPYEGGEVAVVCHEAGHSIGIAKLSATYTEVYDSDAYSIMSYVRKENAKYMAPYWYYSKEYWATANLSYYRIRY